MDKDIEKELYIEEELEKYEDYLRDKEYLDYKEKETEERLEYAYDQFCGNFDPTEEYDDPEDAWEGIEDEERERIEAELDEEIDELIEKDLQERRAELEEEYDNE